MAEENTKEEVQQEPFLVGGEKIEGDYWGGKEVSKNAGGLRSWKGSEKIERDAKDRAVKIGDRDIGRNPTTGAIESLGGEQLDWKTAEKLQRFLDGR